MSEIEYGAYAFLVKQLPELFHADSDAFFGGNGYSQAQWDRLDVGSQNRVFEHLYSEMAARENRLRDARLSVTDTRWGSF